MSAKRRRLFFSHSHTSFQQSVSVDWCNIVGSKHIAGSILDNVGLHADIAASQYWNIHITSLDFHESLI